MTYNAGTVTSTLQGNSSSFVQAHNQAAAAMFKSKAAVDAMALSLYKGSAAAQQNQKAAAGLMKGFKDAGGQASRFAGSLGQMSGALGAVGGDSQKAAAALGGLVSMIGTGPGGIALGAAAGAFALLNAEIQEQEAHMKRLDAAWGKFSKTALEARTAAVAGAQQMLSDIELTKAKTGDPESDAVLEKEHQIESRILTVRAQQLAIETALKGLRLEALRTTGKEHELAQARVTDAEAALATLETAKNALGTQFINAEALVDAESRLQKLAEARAEAETNIKNALADQRARFAEIVALAARLGDEGVRASLSLVPGTLGAAFAGMGVGGRDADAIAAINGTAGVGEEDRLARDAIAIQEEKRRAIEEAIAVENLLTDANLERMRAERELADVLNGQRNAFMESSITRASRDFAPDLSSIAGAAASGNGGAAAMSALMGAGGSAASMALGDPTGMIGGAAGGALGGMLGGVIDRLPSLVKAGDVFIEILETLATPMDALFAPLVVVGDAFKMLAELAVPFVTKWEGMFGAVFMVGARLLEAFMPLAGVILYGLNPTVLALTAILDHAVIPFLGWVSKGLELLGHTMVTVANAMIDFANTLGADLKKIEADFFGSDDDKKDALKDAIRRNTDATEANTRSFTNENQNLPPGFKEGGGIYDAIQTGGAGGRATTETNAGAGQQIVFNGPVTFKSNATTLTQLGRDMAARLAAEGIGVHGAGLDDDHN